MIGFKARCAIDLIPSTNFRIRAIHLVPRDTNRIFRISIFLDCFCISRETSHISYISIMTHHKMLIRLRSIPSITCTRTHSVTFILCFTKSGTKAKEGREISIDAFEKGGKKSSTRMWSSHSTKFLSFVNSSSSSWSSVSEILFPMLGMSDLASSASLQQRLPVASNVRGAVFLRCATTVAAICIFSMLAHKSQNATYPVATAQKTQAQYVQIAGVRQPQCFPSP